MNTFLIKVLAISIITYIFFVFLLFIFQRKLLYYPTENKFSEETSLKHKVDKIYISTQDGLNLIGWFHQKSIAKKTLLFFHGNAGTLDNRIYKLNHIGDCGVNFLIIAYRGFNGNPGKPSEKGLYLDAEAALSWLNSKSIATENIVIYGESLGTSVAIEIGQNKNFSGIILEAPFTSMVSVGKKHYPLFPVKLLLKDKYENANKVKNIKFPILVMHGKKDSIIPFVMGEKIYNLANVPKFKYFPEKDDHMMEFNENLINKMCSFLKNLN